MICGFAPLKGFDFLIKGTIFALAALQHLSRKNMSGILDLASEPFSEVISYLDTMNGLLYGFVVI